jgi:hypothetical protein
MINFDLQAVTHPFASAGSFLIWVAAVSLAIGTIWKTWLRHVALRTRVAVEAIIELRDLMKTELHLPGDERTGHSGRTSLREDLQALTRVLTDAIEQLKRGNERFSEHEGRIDDHEVRIVALEGAVGGET